MRRNLPPYLLLAVLGLAGCDVFQVDYLAKIEGVPPLVFSADGERLVAGDFLYSTSGGWTRLARLPPAKNIGGLDADSGMALYIEFPLSVPEVFVRRCELADLQAGTCERGAAFDYSDLAMWEVFGLEVVRGGALFILDYVGADGNNHAFVADATDGRVLCDFPWTDRNRPEAPRSLPLAIFPGGEFVAVAAEHRQWGVEPSWFQVDLREISGCQTVRTLLTTERAPRLLRASDDGLLAILLDDVDPAGIPVTMAALVDPADGQPLAVRQVNRFGVGQLNDVASWSTDGRYLAVNTDFDELSIWSAPQLQTIRTIGSSKTITGAAFSVDGDLLAISRDLPGGQVLVYPLDLPP